MSRKRKTILLAWRIADSRFPIFDGGGAARYGARWNSPGHRLIYCSSTLALCMLEFLAHTGSNLPNNARYVRIGSSESISIELVEERDIPEWNVADSAAAKKYGDDWARELRSCVLSVPSVVMPNGERNLIINQDHPEFAKLRATKPVPMDWDPRLRL